VVWFARLPQNVNSSRWLRCLYVYTVAAELGTGYFCSISSLCFIRFSCTTSGQKYSPIFSFKCPSKKKTSLMLWRKYYTFSLSHCTYMYILNLLNVSHHQFIKILCFSSPRFMLLLCPTQEDTC
jgi:hypothetical protein